MTEETIVWELFAHKKPPKDSAYLYLRDIDRVEVHYYDVVADVWYYGMSGDMDDIQKNPILWAHMPTGRPILNAGDSATPDQAEVPAEDPPSA